MSIFIIGSLISIDTIYDTMYNASREVFIMSKWDKLLLRIRNLSKDRKRSKTRRSDTVPILRYDIRSLFI